MIHEELLQYRPVEIDRLVQSLLNLKSALILTSSDNDVNHIIDYSNSEYIFNNFKNREGSRMCQSNIGNLQSQLLKYDKAIYHLALSLENIELKKFLSYTINDELDDSDSLLHKIEMSYRKEHICSVLPIALLLMVAGCLQTACSNDDTQDGNGSSFQIMGFTRSGDPAQSYEGKEAYSPIYLFLVDGVNPKQGSARYNGSEWRISGFTNEDMHAIHTVYNAVFHGTGGTVSERLAKVRREVKNNKYAMDAIDFIENRSKRGIGTSQNAE